MSADEPETPAEPAPKSEPKKNTKVTANAKAKADAEAKAKAEADAKAKADAEAEAKKTKPKAKPQAKTTAKAKVGAEAEPKAEEPKPEAATPVVSLAITKPTPSGRCMEEYWQVTIVAEATGVRGGALQVFCNDQLVSCPNAVGLRLSFTCFLPGKGGKVFIFTAKHLPSGAEAKPVTVKTETVGYGKFNPIGWFHKIGDALDKTGFFK